MKTYIIEFVIAGTNELRKGTIKAKTENIAYNSVIKTYGLCEYFKINEL
jgi:hypothetical protein